VDIVPLVRRRLLLSLALSRSLSLSLSHTHARSLARTISRSLCESKGSKQTIPPPLRAGGRSVRESCRRHCPARPEGVFCGKSLAFPTSCEVAGGRWGGREGRGGGRYGKVVEGIVLLARKGLLRPDRLPVPREDQVLRHAKLHPWFRVQVWGLGFRVSGQGFRVDGVGFMVHG